MVNIKAKFGNDPKFMFKVMNKKTRLIHLTTLLNLAIKTQELHELMLALSLALTKLNFNSFMTEVPIIYRNQSIDLQSKSQINGLVSI